MEYLSQLYWQIQSSQHHQQGIVKRLNTPIGHSDLQRLLLASPLLPETDQEAIGSFEYEPVLDIKLYINLEERFREQEYKQKSLDGFEMEKEHILHKMIFDSINECLDYKRIGGIAGLGLQFSRKYKEPARISEKQAMDILEVCKDQVTNWHQLKNGTIMEKEPAYSYNNDIEGIDVLREKAMSYLLADYVFSSLP